MGAGRAEKSTEEDERQKGDRKKIGRREPGFWEIKNSRQLKAIGSYPLRGQDLNLRPEHSESCPY